MVDINIHFQAGPQFNRQFLENRFARAIESEFSQELRDYRLDSNDISFSVFFQFDKDPLVVNIHDIYFDEVEAGTVEDLSVLEALDNAKTELDYVDGLSSDFTSAFDDAIENERNLIEAEYDRLVEDVETWAENIISQLSNNYTKEDYFEEDFLAEVDALLNLKENDAVSRAFDTLY